MYIHVSVLYQTKDLGPQKFYALALRHRCIYRSNTATLPVINLTTVQFLIVIKLQNNMKIYLIFLFTNLVMKIRYLPTALWNFWPENQKIKFFYLTCQSFLQVPFNFSDITCTQLLSVRSQQETVIIKRALPDHVCAFVLDRQGGRSFSIFSIIIILFSRRQKVCNDWKQATTQKTNL